MFAEKNIILASKSPRRRQLLEKADIQFTVKVKHVEEVYPLHLERRNIPVYLAHQKAIAVKGECAPVDLIIAADTMVLFDDQIIGKPADEAEAKDMLALLSGRRHKVITGVCLLKGKKLIRFSTSTSVYFRKLRLDQIDYYIEQYKPLDKAGAYGIQEWIGLVAVEKIEGCFYNVMGLPVGKLIEKIQQHY